MSAVAKLLATTAMIVLPSLAPAQNTAADMGDVAKFELLPGWRQNSGTHLAAVRITLADGWKTYWRVRGETGIPPQFDFDGSENIGSVKIHWPTPSVMDVQGFTVIGYAKELVLPIEITPKQPGLDVVLAARLDLGVCSDLCMPVTVNFAATLKMTDSQENAVIRTALASVPLEAQAGGLRAISCSLAAIEDGFALTARIDMPLLGQGAETTVFELANPDVWIAPARSVRAGDILEVTTDVINYGGGAFNLDPAALRVTVLGPKQAVNIEGCPFAG